MSPQPSAEEIENMTPMLRQFFELKAQCPDAILLFRMGDFYELFGQDAEEIAPKLELVLTSRERGDKNKIPFCGVPHHSAKNYWLKLLKLGYRVAIADQVEDPQEAKGLVRREIVQVLTPACIDELEGLKSDEPNYLLAMHEDPRKKVWAIALVDVSTGEFRLGNLEDHQQIIELIGRFQPREILLRRFLKQEWQERLEHDHEQRLWSELPEAALREKKPALQSLQERFAANSLSELPCGSVQAGLELTHAVFHYLESIKASTAQFLTIRGLRDPHRLQIDATATRDLELFETVRRRERLGSLFHELNACCSAMGARRLRAEMQSPLMQKDAIAARLDAVQALLERPEVLQSIRESLHTCPDIERLTTRVLNAKAHPYELDYLRRTLLRAQALVATLGSFAEEVELFSGLYADIECFEGPLQLLERALEVEPSALGQDLRVIRSGFIQRFDELKDLALNGEQRLRDYEQKLRDETGISSLKIKSHKTFGLLIEVTKANLNRVPETFIRRQTMVNNERFMTDELLALDEEISRARDEAVVLERQIYESLLSEMGRFKAELYKVATAIAVIDFLHSLAWVAKQGQWTRPEVSPDRSLRLDACRHPVVERFVGPGNFTANHLHLTKQEQCLLITGPNMAGKSTVMRQTALAVLMHQMGSFLPARAAQLPIYDRIFTRVGAADDLSRGQSTFMVEMSEAANILRSATSRSLVILDEVGRGTSSQDGLAIAAAILETLSQSLKATCLFATHYHELVELADALPGVRNVQIEVLESGGAIEFTHRLCDGASGSSYGIEVAKLAGVPEVVIARAQQYLKRSEWLEQQKLLLDDSAQDPRKQEQEMQPAHFAEESRQGGKSVMLPLERRGLESELHLAPAKAAGMAMQDRAVLDRIRSLDCYRLTPMQALNLLDELKSSLSYSDSIDLFEDSRY